MIHTTEEFPPADENLKVRELLPTKAPGLTFSFYVPRAGEVSPRAWESIEERETAVDLVFELKP